MKVMERHEEGLKTMETNFTMKVMKRHEEGLKTMETITKTTKQNVWIGSGKRWFAYYRSDVAGLLETER